MILQMHAVTVEVTESEEIQVAQPDGSGELATVRLTVEQVPFLVDLLQQAKAVVDEMRYKRQKG